MKEKLYHPKPLNRIYRKLISKNCIGQKCKYYDYFFIGQSMEEICNKKGECKK